MRLLTFLPIYGAKCLDFKLTTFYQVIIRNIVSVAVLSILALVIQHVFYIDTWLKLIGICIVIALVGLSVNILTLFNKEDLRQLTTTFRQMLHRKGE